MQCGVGDETEGIDDGCGVHPQGDDGAEKDFEIAVFGGERGDDKSQSQSYTGECGNDDGEEAEVEVGSYVHALQSEDEIDNDKRHQLQREAEEFGNDDRDGRYQSGEIHFAIESGVGGEGVGYGSEAGGEILPEADA